ncbi:MAG: hypothetical protein K0Q73_8109 [Paenibacillus sp.]|jgi:hypothetical protein|nr:hypothetical protein [Paenibacillus sp.]
MPFSKRIVRSEIPRKNICYIISQPPSINITLTSDLKQPNGPSIITKIGILPIVKRYFYIAETNIHLTSIKTISVNQFVNDEAEYADQFIDFGQNGYFNLFINAVLQEGNLYTVSKEALTIASTGQSIPSGTPIILESVGFTAEII